ncbi:aldo-keto reductase family 1 member B1 [Halyomorpha halys]|uniref:aldo-keto reductase family 1 member B1 n=1 Tax=Halyomorpha halys TaxID=286706 RepID=UPI0006D51563|nr:aldose reductase-like isoform X1 [Halyomorpha halys]
MSAKVPVVKLNNNLDYPIIGLGTWKSKPDEVYQAVKDAIDIGYRHFDCAYLYENEKEVGAALSEKIKEGAVKREELFIVTKLWNTDHKKELVVPALKRSLELLNLEYVDLYLIHWPLALKEGVGLFPKDADGKTLFSDAGFIDTWKGMEECVKLGLTKSIGLSNFNHKQIQKVLDIAKIKPVNNQVECHPYFNQSKLIEFCSKNDITVTAYGPLGSPYRPLRPGATTLLEDPVVKTLSEEYKKSPAQILIKYQIQRNVVVIPKTVTKSRIASNFDVFDFTISPEDMELLNSLNKPDGRYVLLDDCVGHPDYPFNEEF